MNLLNVINSLRARWLRIGSRALLPPYGKARHRVVACQIERLILPTLVTYAGHIGFNVRIVPVDSTIIPFLQFLTGAADSIGKSCGARPGEASIIEGLDRISRSLFLTSELPALAATAKQASSELNDRGSEAGLLGTSFGEALLREDRDASLQIYTKLLRMHFRVYLSPRESQSDGPFPSATNEPQRVEGAQPQPPLTGASRYLQARVAGLGALALLLALLFPPFEFRLPDGLVANAGFAFIFTPPSRGGLAASVNVPLLVSVLFCLGVVVGLALMVTHYLRRSDEGGA